MVIFAGVKNGCGNEILIRHANNYQTRYCHMQKFYKGIKKGKKVIQGETIGYVGSTGLATGPHLHYEFRIGAKRPRSEGPDSQSGADMDRDDHVMKDPEGDVEMIFVLQGQIVEPEPEIGIQLDYDIESQVHVRKAA